MIPEADRDLEHFCYNIAWLRAHHGLSKKKMAELLGIGIKSLNRLESGTMPPRLGLKVFFAVQAHFGISPAKMLANRFGADDEKELIHSD